LTCIHVRDRLQQLSIQSEADEYGFGVEWYTNPIVAEIEIVIFPFCLTAGAVLARLRCNTRQVQWQLHTRY
jgi:hypothetical protein